MSRTEDYQNYPLDEGWTHASMRMRADKPLSEQQIKKIVTIGEAPTETFEWGKIEQKGQRILAIYRPLNRKEVALAHA